MKLCHLQQYGWTLRACAVCVVASVMSNFVNLWTIVCQAPLSMGFARQEYWNGLPFLSPGDLPDPGIKHSSPAVQVDSLPAEPQGKPKNTGVGSLFLLQQIFSTQEWNWGLLHCRWILYLLNYQGSPGWLSAQS